VRFDAVRCDFLRDKRHFLLQRFDWENWSKKMPVITFASSKGGAGKTTSAIILATTLCRRRNVTIIDADPAKRLMSWASKADLPGRLHVRASKGEHHIHDEIEAALNESDYVVLDLEGAATRLNAFAMGESDLVIIPMGDEQPDAEGAIETISQVRLEERSLRRSIPCRVLFCRTQAAVKSRLAKSLNEQVRSKVGSFDTELHIRTAFSTLHNTGGTLYDLDPKEVSGVNKAIANAELFEEELEQVLRAVSRLHGATKKTNLTMKGQDHDTQSA
jgi:chromosome partitioning protein